MSNGQWRVFGLLLLLLFLESIKSQAVRDFFKNLGFNPFRQALQ